MSGQRPHELSLVLAASTSHVLVDRPRQMSVVITGEKHELINCGASKTGTRGWAGLLERDRTADAPEDAVELERMDVGPFALLCASLRVDDVHSAYRLAITVFDEGLGRASKITIPLRRTQDEPVISA
jgi:hypothetical protein